MLPNLQKARLEFNSTLVTEKSVTKLVREGTLQELLLFYTGN